MALQTCTGGARRSTRCQAMLQLLTAVPATLQKRSNGASANGASSPIPSAVTSSGAQILYVDTERDAASNGSGAACHLCLGHCRGARLVSGTLMLKCTSG